MTANDISSILGNVIFPFLTLVATIYINRDKFEFKFFKTGFPGINLFIFTIVNLLVGVLVISIGFLLEPFLYETFLHGIGEGVYYLFWRLGESPQSLIIAGLLPGTLTASVAMSSKTLSDKIRNSSFVAITTLIIIDFIKTESTGRFFFSAICDFVGGILAGIIISYLVVFLANSLISNNKTVKSKKYNDFIEEEEVKDLLNHFENEKINMSPEKLYNLFKDSNDDIDKFMDMAGITQKFEDRYRKPSHSIYSDYITIYRKYFNQEYSTYEKDTDD